MNFKDLDLKIHMHDGTKCSGFDITVGEVKFHLIRDIEEPRIWKMKSYEDLLLPTLAVEMPKDDCDLTLIAKTAMYCLTVYLKERQEFESDLINSVETLMVTK